MRKVLNMFLAILMCASVAAALDQPNMKAARGDLNKAENSLRKATADKGGHREKALNLIERAITEINRGIEYDRNHITPGRRGRRGSSDFEENNFAAASDQPNMKAAKEHLQDAINHLQRADKDKGGHREKAIELVRDAIAEVNKGIAFDRSN